MYPEFYEELKNRKNFPQIGSFKLINIQVVLDDKIIYDGDIQDATDEIKELYFYKSEFLGNKYKVYVSSEINDAIIKNNKKIEKEKKELEEINKKRILVELKEKEQEQERILIEQQEKEKEFEAFITYINKEHKKKPITHEDRIIDRTNENKKNSQYSDKNYKDMTELEIDVEIRKLFNEETTRYAGALDAEINEDTIDIEDNLHEYYESIETEHDPEAIEENYIEYSLELEAQKEEEKELINHNNKKTYTPKPYIPTNKKTTYEITCENCKYFVHEKRYPTGICRLKYHNYKRRENDPICKDYNPKEKTNYNYQDNKQYIEKYKYLQELSKEINKTNPESKYYMPIETNEIKEENTDELILIAKGMLYFAFIIAIILLLIIIYLSFE